MIPLKSDETLYLRKKADKPLALVYQKPEVMGLNIADFENTLEKGLPPYSWQAEAPFPGGNYQENRAIGDAVHPAFKLPAKKLYKLDFATFEQVSEWGRDAQDLAESYTGMNQGWYDIEAQLTELIKNKTPIPKQIPILDSQTQALVKEWEQDTKNFELNSLIDEWGYDAKNLAKELELNQLVQEWKADLPNLTSPTLDLGPRQFPAKKYNWQFQKGQAYGWQGDYQATIFKEVAPLNDLVAEWSEDAQFMKLVDESKESSISLTEIKPVVKTPQTKVVKTPQTNLAPEWDQVVNFFTPRPLFVVTEDMVVAQEPVLAIQYPLAIVKEQPLVFLEPIGTEVLEGPVLTPEPSFEIVTDDSLPVNQITSQYGSVLLAQPVYCNTPAVIPGSAGLDNLLPESRQKMRTQITKINHRLAQNEPIVLTDADVESIDLPLIFDMNKDPKAIRRFRNYPGLVKVVNL